MKILEFLLGAIVLGIVIIFSMMCVESYRNQRIEEKLKWIEYEIKKEANSNDRHIESLKSDMMIENYQDMEKIWKHQGMICECMKEICTKLDKMCDGCLLINEKVNEIGKCYDKFYDFHTKQ